jgi:RNA polymerase sigma-70 factor (ECF subfamily)
VKGQEGGKVKTGADPAGSGASLSEIECLYRSRFAEFVRVASAITGGVDEGQEAVHEAFVNAVRGRRQYRADGPLDAWLWRMTVRCALKSRRRREFATLSASSDVPGVETNDRHVEDYESVRDAIRRLPERQRVVLFLRYYADLDYATIGDALDMKSGTVAATLHTAHAAVQRRLEGVPMHGRA